MRKRLLLAGVAVLPALVALWLLWPTTPPTPVSMPASVLARLQPGDLIFREGTEPVSDMVQLADHGSWSHVGMLLRGPHGWQVIHAVPAEAPGRQDAVVIDSLAFFEAPKQAQAVAVYHVQASTSQHQQALSFARQHLGEAFGFDPGQTYCTKFLWSAWQHAGVDLKVHFSTLHIPLMPSQYLLPSDLLASPKLHPVWSSTSL